MRLFGSVLFSAPRHRVYALAPLALAVALALGLAVLLASALSPTAISRANGPPDLGEAFTLPFKLEQGRPAPARSSSGPRQPSNPATPAPDPAPAPRSAPSVMRVAVTSDPGGDDTYLLGETIRITLTFSEAVEVTGTPRLKIDMDPADWGEKSAGYEAGSGTDSLTFSHTVVEPNYSTQGIAVLEDTLELNGGTIRSASSQTDVDLSHTGLGHNAAHRVDWQQAPSAPTTTTPAPAPTVPFVAVSSVPGVDGSYALGETIRVTLSFSEAVIVTGSPRLAIDMDPADWGTKWAGYERGSGTSGISFAHTVVEPNFSSQGIAVVANSLELNGGTIRSASSQVDADLSHDGREHAPSHKVDWQLSPPPPNRAPVVNTESQNYQRFVNEQNAPRGILVSKVFAGLFSDPDGDKLTYTVSITDGRAELVDDLVIGSWGRSDLLAAQSRAPREASQRVFIEVDDEDDWGAIEPAVAARPVISVTVTATDPTGLSASISGDFLIHWESQPEVVSAVASEQAIELTFDTAVEADPAPTAEQFTVNVVNGDGTAGTIPVTSVSVNGAVVTLNLATALAPGQALTVDYAHDDDTPLKRASEGGDHAASFAGQAVDMSQLGLPGEPPSLNRGYRGELGEVLVELSLRRPAPSNRRANGGAGIASVPPGDSAHTTSIVYVIDDSGSMDGDFPEVRTALEDVRGTTMANTKVALIKFGTSATTVFGLTDHSTDASSGPWTDARINAFGGKLGGTYYTAPLQNAKALLDADTVATNKKIIFLTDGQEDRPIFTVEAIIRAGIVVDTIGFGDHYSENFGVIEAIATDSSGTYRAVNKPSQGTTNSPAVTASHMSDILKGAVADNTATLFLVDKSFSVYDLPFSLYDKNKLVLHPALNDAAAKAGDADGSGRQVGLAMFLGEHSSFIDAEKTPELQKYEGVHAIGSSSLALDPWRFIPTGSTDLDHALSQAFLTVTDSTVTATSKRVVLITDGISAVDVQTATLDSYKNDSSVTLDVVAWGDHADRVKLKEWADSASGNFSVAKNPPAWPRGFQITTGDATYTMSWDDARDSAITKYQYQVWVRETTFAWSEWMDIPGSGATTTWHIVTGVPNGKVQFAQVRAVRGDVLGPSIQWSGRPMSSGMDLTATAGDAEIALSWNDPSDSTITKYQYTQRTEDGAWSDWTDIAGSSATTTSHTVASLTNDTAYTIALRAVQGTGDTKTYGPVSAVTATPSAPNSG